MYQVIGTVATISILYLISFFFYRSGFYSKGFHRMIWNTILALSFVFTALAGIFLALQVNYKWDIPFMKAFLRWHVEAGSLLATTGLFHLVWHFTYFTRDTKTDKKVTATQNNFSGVSASSLAANLFITGLTGTVVQLILIRELMNVSGGYELNTGIFLASWLLASAAGAIRSGKSELFDLGKLNLIFSFSTLLSPLLLILFTRFFLEPGESPSLLITLLLTLLMLIPFCFVSGFLFVRLVSASKVMSGSLPGRSYSIETLGGICGGIIITILGNGILNSYQIYLLLVLLTMFFTLKTYFLKKKTTSVAIRILTAAFAIVIIISKPDILFRQALLPVITVKETTDTPYGNITRGEYASEQSFYYDHRLQSFNDDVADSEENIHYALLQVKNPESVIVISGKIRSLLPELLKYNLKKIIFIERDPVLLSLQNDGIINERYEYGIISTDAFSYIRHSQDKTDAVIMLLPPPGTLSLNRYYTKEFFSEVKRVLNRGGVFVCSPGNEVNYLNQETIDLYSSVYASLKEAFSNVKPIAGNRLYLLASDDSLSTAICNLSEERNIKNTYVSSDFLADDLINLKSSEIENSLKGKGEINSALSPVACIHYQKLNLSKNINEKPPALVLIIVLFASPLFLVRRKNFIMYTSALSLAGFEIICLMLVQIIAGNMYLFTSLVVAGLMAGLAIGSGVKTEKRIPLNLSPVVLIIFYLIAGAGLKIISGMESGFFTFTVLFILIFLPSILTGFLFRELTKNDTDGTLTATVYGSDLAGSAFGFILVSGFLIPVIGLTTSVFILAAFIFAGILLGTEWNKY